MMTVNIADTYDRGSYEYEREMRRRKREIRRKREVRRNLSMIILGILIVLCLSLSYHTIISKASGDLDGISYKYYTSVMVENGDSLWSFAQEYADEHYADAEDYIYEVMQINHLQDEEIAVGDYLILPYYSEISVMTGDQSATASVTW